MSTGDHNHGDQGSSKWNDIHSEDKKGLGWWWLVIVAAIIVAILAYPVYRYLSQHPASQKLTPHDIGIVSVQPALPEMCTTADCKHRLAAMHAKVAWEHAHHHITDAQASAADQYLNAHPNGTVDKDGTVRWTSKMSDCCTLRMSYHACGCDHKEVAVVKVVDCPKPKVVHHDYRPPPQDSCVEVTFNAPVGSKVDWLVGSTDGPMPASRCNKQRQGGGRYHDWYDSQCPNWCVSDMLAYIQNVIGEAADDVVDHVYGASERKQTLRYSTAIWTKSLGICVEYPDHTMHAVYIHPVGPGAWNHRHRVMIPDSLWGS